jgi:hypothetical protein
MTHDMNLPLTPFSSPHSRFDAMYITSTALMREVGVSRTAMLHARQRGWLPDGIVVNEGQLYMWERAALQPYIDAWKLITKTRKKNSAQAAPSA